MGRKRKHHSYVDRQQAIQLQSKPQNVIDGVTALECDRLSIGSLERHFKYKLQVADEGINYLVALVMNNDICVLVMRLPVKVEKVAYKLESNSDTVSGKRKGGAKYLKAGSSIAEITLIDGTLVDLLTPVRKWQSYVSISSFDYIHLVEKKNSIVFKDF